MKIVDQYKTFKYETLVGKKDKTAQFWEKYCKILDLYQLLHWSIKSNDVDMFRYALIEHCSMSFFTKHQNYA